MPFEGALLRSCSSWAYWTFQPVVVALLLGSCFCPLLWLCCLGLASACCCGFAAQALFLAHLLGLASGGSRHRRFFLPSLVLSRLLGIPMDSLTVGAQKRRYVVDTLEHCSIGSNVVYRNGPDAEWIFCGCFVCWIFVYSRCPPFFDHI